MIEARDLADKFGFQEANLFPKEGVIKTFEDAQIDKYLTFLSDSFEPTINRRVIEDGNRLVVSIDWKGEKENASNRVSLSIREGTIGFCGDSHQFTRLTGEELNNEAKVDEAFFQALSNPLSLTKVEFKN